MSEYLPLLLAVSVAHILAVASPGPDFFLCVRQSLAHGRAAGVWTGAGFALGVACHCSFAALGLAVVIERSLLLFTIVKFLGAAYLLYMAVMVLRSRSSGDSPPTNEFVPLRTISAWRALSAGFVTNLLNPKAILYFLGIFTMVVSPDVPLWVLAAISAVMIVLTFVWFALVAFFFTRPGVRSAFSRWENTINRVFGVVLVGFAVRLATLDRN
jgi:RhtB (resistance to homoserine/threonine) family protein